MEKYRSSFYPRIKKRMKNMFGSEFPFTERIPSLPFTERIPSLVSSALLDDASIDPLVTAQESVRALEEYTMRLENRQYNLEVFLRDYVVNVGYLDKISNIKPATDDREWEYKI